jgi:hypothetical protein
MESSSEYVYEGLNGLYVMPTEEDIYRKLSYLIANPNVVENIKRRAHEINDCFGAEAALDKMYNLFHELNHSKKII